MSTKIYEGRRLAEGVTVWDVLPRLREAMDPIRDRLDITELLRRAIWHLDTVVLPTEPTGDGPGLDSPLSFALIDYQREQGEMNPAHRGHDPHRFEASFGFDPGTGRTLMCPFFDNPAYGSALDDMSEIEEYGYWNNTDQPDGVDDTEWEERRLAWERVTPGAPMDTMVTFQLRGDVVGWRMLRAASRGTGATMVGEVLGHVTSTSHTPAARASRLIRSVAYTQMLRRQVEAHGEEAAKGLLWGTYSAAQAVGAELADHLVGHLPPLTVDTLYERPTPGRMPGRVLDTIRARVAEVPLP